MSLKCEEWTHKKSLSVLNYFFVYQSEFRNHVVMMVGTVLDFWQNLTLQLSSCPWKAPLEIRGITGLILSAVVSMPPSFCAFCNTRVRSLWVYERSCLLYTNICLVQVCGLLRMFVILCAALDSTTGELLSKYLTVTVSCLLIHRADMKLLDKCCMQ